MKDKLAVAAAIASVAVAGLLLVGCAVTAFVAIFLPGGHPPLSAYFAVVVILVALWAAPLGVALGAWGAAVVRHRRKTLFRFAAAGAACNAALFLWAAYLFVIG